MKFIHLSDLHIGIRINEFSMFEDQEYIFTKIINAVDDENVDGVFIAGDIYDKSVPSPLAVQLFDDFLTKLANRNISVFIISGNHDSAERIAFGSNIMNGRNVYLSPVYNGKINPVVLNDKHGTVKIYMLPFIKPAHVKRFYPEDNIESYNEAVRKVIETMQIDKQNRNILIAHQFVTGASRCESEEIAVGGIDNIDVSLFEPFDYVALGHIHNPQNIGRETVRYSGTPLKYSFSEANVPKSLTVLDITEKNINIKTIPLIGIRDMREIKGNFSDIVNNAKNDKSNKNDYIHITLTDEEDVIDAIGKLREIFPNIMKIDYDNIRTRKNQKISPTENLPQKTPAELFEEFYISQNNQAMSSEQKSFCLDLMEEIWGTRK